MSDIEDTEKSGDDALDEPSDVEDVDDVASGEEYEIEPIDETPGEELDDVGAEAVESDAWQEGADEYDLEDIDDVAAVEPVDDATPPADSAEENLEEVAVEPVDGATPPAESDDEDLEEVAVEPVEDDDPATLDEVAVEPIDDEFDDADEATADDADGEVAPAETDEAPPEDDGVDPGPQIEVQRSTERRTTDVEPLPEPGEYATAPTVTIYRAQSAVDAVDIDSERTVFGSRRPATSTDEPEPSADVDDISDDDVESVDDAAVEEALEIEPIDDEDIASAPPEDEAAQEVPTEAAPVDDDGAESTEAPEASPNQPEYIELPDDLPIAAEHIAIYRQNKNYTLYALSDEPTQVNDQLVALGERVKLRDGDVIVVGEEIALGFDLDAA